MSATRGESADATRFAPFVETTAQHFTINEVSADKAYLSKKNLRSVEAVGGAGGILKKCVNSQAVYPLSEQHGLKAQERR